MTAGLISSYTSTTVYVEYISGAVGADTQGIGQSFTANEYMILDYCWFYIGKWGSPTGSAYANLYAHSGTFGTSGIPTGSALATTDAFDVSTLSTSNAWKQFFFSGANRIPIAPGTNYVLTLEFTGGDADNDVQAVYDNTSSTHEGNGSTKFNGTWVQHNSGDFCFYLYGVTKQNFPLWL